MVMSNNYSKKTQRYDTIDLTYYATRYFMQNNVFEYVELYYNYTRFFAATNYQFFIAVDVNAVV